MESIALRIRKARGLLPFIETAKKYSKKKFKADIVAALTVAIIALPQSMAYAIIAGVNPKYGLYAAIVPVMISSLFGSSRFLIAGPTNAISMVVSSTIASLTIGGIAADYLPEEQKMAMIFLLTFMVGMIQLFMGVAKFGSLVNFVSHSVVVGFTAGAGLLIAFNQLKNLLGISIPSTPEFVHTVRNTFSNIDKTNIFALSLGFFTIAFVIVSKKISRKIPGPLLSLILSAVFVTVFHLGDKGVKLIGSIPQSLPPISSFPLDFDTVREIFPGALAISILGIVEAFSIAKSIANSSGEKIKGNQEFIGQGISNIAASFFSAIPGSGSFTRSAVNFSAGAKTRFAGAMSGVFVLIVLVAAAPFARFIPIASLAGILMVISYSLVDKKSLILSWKATRSDRMVLIVTFLATLFLELEMAVYVGVILSLVLFLRKTSYPQIDEVLPQGVEKRMKPVRDSECSSCRQISIYHIDGALFFGAINQIEEKLYSIKKEKGRIIIIRMSGVRIIDASGVHALEKFMSYCKRNDINVIFTNLNHSVVKVLKRSGIYGEMKEHLAEDTTASIALAFRKYIDGNKCKGCVSRLFKECSGE